MRNWRYKLEGIPLTRHIEELSNLKQRYLVSGVLEGF